MDNTPTRSWDYRVIEFVTEDGEVWRSIHEVHYVDGIPRAQLLRLSRLSRCAWPCRGPFWKRWISTPTTQAETT
jgi:hypothetical protein